MSAFDQVEMFEPTGSEVGRLAEAHAQWAVKAQALADRFLLRGWVALARDQERVAAEHEVSATCLAMLAEFEHLAGVA